MEICFEENVMYCIILTFLICATYKFIISIRKKSDFNKFLDAMAEAEVKYHKFNEGEEVDNSESNN